MSAQALFGIVRRSFTNNERRLPAYLAMIAGLLSALLFGPTNAICDDDLPSGTIITTQNWAQYQRFMSQGLVALFKGDFFWHMPKNLQIEVGATSSIPLPKKYLDDTARYAAGVKLVPIQRGGFVPSGYVAGLPFPEPLKGDPATIGQRIFWDSYYRYQPRVQAAPQITYTLDALGNMTRSSEEENVYSQLEFLSDVDFPHRAPDFAGYYFVKYYQQVAPELGKYTTVLDLAPADPTQLDELYEYIPSLRRSLRLSEAARCAPVFGSDYLIDDENYGPPGLPQLFQIEYLGPRKILALEHANPEAFVKAGGPQQLNDNFYYPGTLGFIPFPKPALGKWELRSTYAIALKRLPGADKHYCYSKRVMYVDTENYFGAGELELYDTTGRLYKLQMVFLYPENIPGTINEVAELASGPSVGFIVNFKDRHVTASVGLQSCVNKDCAEAGYLDVHRYASPEALMKIVQ